MLLFPRYSGEVIFRKLYQTQAFYLVNAQKRSHHLNSRQTPHHHVPLKLKHRPLPFIPHLSPSNALPSFLTTSLLPPQFIMGIIRKTLNTLILGGAGGVGGFAFWTRNSKFVPIAADDPIFSSAAYLRNNPSKNPQTKDLCVRKVELSKIKPQLLEKEGEGKLVEAFCAGVWGGIGTICCPRL